MRRAADAVERMDALDCDPLKLERTYQQFGLVNRLFSGWRRLYVQELRPLLSQKTITTVLDIGSGGGDLARLLDRWSRNDKLLLEITGTDPDARAYGFAASRPHHPTVSFVQADSGDLVRLGRRFDVVISNHVIHHLQPADVTRFLADSQALAGQLCLHNDLRRSMAAYGLFALAALPFRGSFIRSDGLVSIRRSYTPAELADITPPGWSVQRHGMFHQVLVHRPVQSDD